MKLNWKKMVALLLAVILMLSLSGLGEDAIVIEDGAAVEGDLLDNIPVLEDLDLAGDVNILDSLDLDISTEMPKADEEAAPEEVADDESISSNALIKMVKLGVNEKYTIDTSSLSGRLTFKSSKPAIANVSNKGIIKGKKVGTAKISVTTSTGRKYKISVTVAKAPSKVTLNKTSADLEVGDTLQLKATLPSKTASNKMTWTSSNKNVATVSDKGKVTAKAAGSATITVKTFNGKKATCKVTVEDIDDDDDDDDDDIPPEHHGTETGELSRFIGQSLEYFNSVIADPVEEGRTANDYFTIYTSNDGRIEQIYLRSGYNRYTLFGVYPGMYYGDAQGALTGYSWYYDGSAGAGWYIYKNSSYPGMGVVIRITTSNYIDYLAFQKINS